MNKKDTFEALKRMVPENAAQIEIRYDGSGDDFNSFHSTTIYDEDGYDITGEVNVYELEQTAQDYTFELFNKTSYVDFNNDGCSGSITFDLDHFTATLVCQNYCMEESENPDEFF